jgi:hypothetical protein
MEKSHTYSYTGLCGFSKEFPVGNAGERSIYIEFLARLRYI